MSAHPQTLRDPIGSATEGPSGCARMCHTPHTFRGPVGNFTEGPSCCTHMRPTHPFLRTFT
eukprot:5277138-Pyramimonas_sp.AAC.1